MGVERKLSILNMTMTVAMVMGMNDPLYAIGGIFTHWVLRWTTRSDPNLLKIYARYAMQGNMYEPWPKVSQHRNRRPADYHPERLC